MYNINSQTDSEQPAVGLSSSNLIKYSQSKGGASRQIGHIAELLVGDILQPDTHLILSTDRITHTIRITMPNTIR